MRNLNERDNIKAELVRASKNLTSIGIGFGHVPNDRGPSMNRGAVIRDGYATAPESNTREGSDSNRRKTSGGLIGRAFGAGAEAQGAVNSARVHQVNSPDDYTPETDDDCQRVYDVGVAALLAKNEDLIREKSSARSDLTAIGERLDTISEDLLVELGIDVAKTLGGALLAAKEGRIAIMREIIEGLLEVNADVNDYYDELKQLESDTQSIETTIEAADTEIADNEALIESSNRILARDCEGRYVSYPVGV